MVDYQRATGDASYFNVTYEALVSQISPTYNYLPVAEKFDEVSNPLFFSYLPRRFWMGVFGFPPSLPPSLLPPTSYLVLFDTFLPFVALGAKGDVLYEGLCHAGDKTPRVRVSLVFLSSDVRWTWDRATTTWDSGRLARWRRRNTTGRSRQLRTRRGRRCATTCSTTLWRGGRWRRTRAAAG